MSYYIDSPIGPIYFNSNNKFLVFLSQNSCIIRRRNISFINENKFAEFSNLYKWIYMNILSSNGKYYLSIYLNNNTYETLNIHYSHIIDHKGDLYSFL